MSETLLARQAAGYFGFERIADTTKHTPSHGGGYAFIMAIGGPVTLDGTGTVTTRGDNPGSDEIPEGVPIPGPFESVQRASGAQIYAYYANDPNPPGYEHDTNP